MPSAQKLLSPLMPLFKQPTHRRGISVTGRILIINVITLVLVVVGLFTFGRSMDRLIDSESAILERQASLIASTLGEVAVENTPEGDTLKVDPARQIIRRLVETTDARTQVFTANMLLIADSRLLLGAGRYVQIEQLPPPKQMIDISIADRIVEVFDWLAMLLPYERNLPVYVESGMATAEQWPDVTEALKGNYRRTLWTTKDNKLILTVTVPIQRFRQVVGAVMLTQDGETIAEAIRRLRSDLLQVVSLVLGASALLSLYMAQTIARPLRRLAKAANAARAMTTGRPEIPDLTRRGDEIGDLSETLIGMTDTLWKRLDATEHFAADVAHELKNPLSSMHSALETLPRIEDAGRRQKLLQILKEDVLRMERLISDIAATARLEGELTRATPEIFDLLDLVRTLEESRVQTGTPLLLETTEHSLMVEGIPSQLTQVLENLIANALSFSPPDAPVIIKVISTSHHIVLTVEDSGPGIPAGKEEKIFERFYSERPAAEKFGTHSGLGLNICRQIIDAHGGQIHAENRLSADGTVTGARFVVNLPKITANISGPSAKH